VITYYYNFRLDVQFWVTQFPIEVYSHVIADRRRTRAVGRVVAAPMVGEAQFRAPQCARRVGVGGSGRSISTCIRNWLSPDIGPRRVVLNYFDVVGLEETGRADVGTNTALTLSDLMQQRCFLPE
jgi:hypothetical protein